MLLYSEDETSAELKVRDEADNITILSPHNFSLTHKSEPMAWSFFSENESIGYKINVDMLKAIRKIEELTGEKLVYLQDLKTKKIVKQENSKESLVENVEKQQKEIKQLKIENEELKQRIEKLENMVNELIEK